VSILAAENVVAMYFAVDGEFGFAQKISTLDYTVNVLTALLGDCYTSLGAENGPLSITNPSATDVHAHTLGRRQSQEKT
jgi:hypothetical protein